MTTSAAASSRPPVAIVGAGIAGLVAARELRRRGISVVVFEASAQVAGMAKSVRDKDGFSYDVGAHFITNRLAKEIGVADACRTVRYYGETVVLGGSTYSYPFGLMRSPRFLKDAIASRIPGRAPAHPPRSAAEVFRREYGERLANEIAIPLTEAWSGAPADELSPAVVEKLAGGALQTAWLKVASRLTRRAVASGYCREQPESVRVWHVYPEAGVSTLCEHLARELGDAIRLETPVEKILVHDGRAVGVRVKGVEQEASAVISTAPVHILSKLVEGTTALNHLARFRYRPMVFVNLRLTGRNLLPDVVTWTPESQFPFFRLTEGPRSMPWLAPEGKTIITVDIGCSVGDEIWKMPEDRLSDLCLDHLEPIIPGVRQRFLGAHVARTPIAYPIFLNEYEADRQRFERSTGVDGLYSIGRNGEFAHILMEDIYWRTLRRMRELTVDGARGATTPSHASVGEVPQARVDVVGHR
jgi:protoporphyrinogen/coproporphyrinogen III oxidase